MHARVSTYRFPADGLDEAVREFENAVPKVQQMEGNKGAVLLVDRASAKGMTITYWESEQAMQGSTGAADEVREGAASAARGSIESVEGYEVAMQL
jgi:heme-degrading monooxygenase HmoA